jgi:hypothetical protein
MRRARTPTPFCRWTIRRIGHSSLRALASTYIISTPLLLDMHIFFLSTCCFVEQVVLPDYYSSASTGMLVPKTKDGRVLFLLPWEEHTVAGTTDAPCEVPTLRTSPRNDENGNDLLEMVRIVGE